MIPDMNDTIVALSSPPGPGKRAIVRITGKQTREIVEKRFHPNQGQPRPRHLTPGFVIMSGVHCPVPTDHYFFAAPNSYTGQDVSELHLVSSPPLVDQLIAELLALGCRPAQPGEFTLRAFLSGKMDLTQAEAVHAVIEAASSRDLRQSLTQLAGGVRRPLDQLRDDLLNLLADVEAGLDFVDEDIEFVAQDQIVQRVGLALVELHQLLRQFDNRSVQQRTVRVVLAGRPNAGKSSLFNALTGSQALVSEVSGTTRDYLASDLLLDDLIVELIDTAGLSTAQSEIEQRAQSLGSEQRDQAEIVLWCVPIGEPRDFAWMPRPDNHDRDCILVRTKADLTPGDEQQDSQYPSQTGIAVSARSGAGLENLRQLLRERVLARISPALAPSLSRCQDHVLRAIQALEQAKSHVLHQEAVELLALELRIALDQIGEMAGSVYTNDLLDRIFSRFCIGK